MAIMRFDPFRTFESAARKMNDLIGEFDKGVTFEYGNFAPRVDISEDEKALFIHAEMPGIKKDDVKVTINDDNLLIIKGSKKQAEEVKNRSFIRVERVFGEFTRTFVLPDNVKKDSIQAIFDGGVLELAFEKIEPEKPKEYEISIS